jgi:hypothetical protein
MLPVIILLLIVESLSRIEIPRAAATTARDGKQLLSDLRCCPEYTKDGNDRLLGGEGTNRGDIAGV